MIFTYIRVCICGVIIDIIRSVVVTVAVVRLTSFITKHDADSDDGKRIRSIISSRCDSANNGQY